MTISYDVTTIATGYARLSLIYFAAHSRDPEGIALFENSQVSPTFDVLQRHFAQRFDFPITGLAGRILSYNYLSFYVKCKNDTVI